MPTSDGPRAKARAIVKLWVGLIAVVALVAAGCGGGTQVPEVAAAAPRATRAGSRSWSAPRSP